MIEMKDAKPCCHCGGTKLFVDHHAKKHDGDGLYRVACICGATGPFAKNEPAAVEAWNRRVVEDALRDQLAAALDGTITALEKAREMREQRDAALALVKRFVDGINDEWCPMFAGGCVLTDDEGKLLREAEAAIQEVGK